MARILVIDHDPDIRVLLEQILKSAGYEVILAADGREGAERFRNCPADLVITELYMPNQEGLETIRELRTCFPEVAIIATSARPDSGTMLSITPDVPAVGILPKPFLADELLAVVDKALGGQPPAPMRRVRQQRHGAANRFRPGRRTAGLRRLFVAQKKVDRSRYSTQSEGE
jgi:DNA-binding response OmpR family regulator